MRSGAVSRPSLTDSSNAARPRGRQRRQVGPGRSARTATRVVAVSAASSTSAPRCAQRGATAAPGFSMSMRRIVRRCGYRAVTPGDPDVSAETADAPSTRDTACASLRRAQRLAHQLARAGGGDAGFELLAAVAAHHEHRQPGRCASRRSADRRRSCRAWSHRSAPRRSVAARVRRRRARPRRSGSRPARSRVPPAVPRRTRAAAPRRRRSAASGRAARRRFRVVRPERARRFAGHREPQREAAAAAGSVRTSMAPPMSATMLCTTDRPSSVPSPTAFVLKNGSNMRP